MGKKGGRKHLKRKAAPKFWPIHRKEAVWSVKPDAGPNAISHCVPLTLILRDILGVAETRSEVKTIVNDGKILVDGKVQREDLFPTGLMNIVSISDMKKWYRVLPCEKGLFLHPISEDEATYKLCRIENKAVLDKGNLQLNLHDGRNVFISVENLDKPEKEVFNTSDTVKISVPKQEIMRNMKFAEGASALIIGGKNIGKHGKIVAIEQKERQKRKNLLVTIEDYKRNRFQTTLEYIFVIGDTKPQISLAEAS